jgi:hypothetical protein
LSKSRCYVCLILITVVPRSLTAGDTGAAMLYSTGGVLLNGNLAPPSSALFPDDFVETPKNALAKIDVNGSTLMIQPESVTQYHGEELLLEHGSVQVNTSTQFRVRVGCVLVAPVTPGWTDYDVVDVNGTLTVSAHKSDVRIEPRIANPRAKGAGQSESITVHEGEQKTRDDKCGAAPPSPADAHGAILNSPLAKWTGIVVIGVVTCWALCRGDNPVSPSTPK